MSNRNLIRIVSVCLALVLLFAMSTHVLASGESVSVDSFDISECAPGAYVVGQVTHVNGTDAVGIKFVLKNHTKLTLDTAIFGILPSGTYGFGLSVPAATEVGDSMTIRIDLLDAGSNVIVSGRLNYYCGGVEPVVAAPAVPGPDLVYIPAEAVVGAIVADTPALFAPQADATTDVVLNAGMTLWVYGVDASGSYYKVMLSGQFYWVPVNTMGPNYDEVWNGTPLPTVVVD